MDGRAWGSATMNPNFQTDPGLMATGPSDFFLYAYNVLGYFGFRGSSFGSCVCFVEWGLLYYSQLLSSWVNTFVSMCHWTVHFSSSGLPTLFCIIHSLQVLSLYPDKEPKCEEVLFFPMEDLPRIETGCSGRWQSHRPWKWSRMWHSVLWFSMVVFSQRLDTIISEAFPNINDSLILGKGRRSIKIFTTLFKCTILSQI